MAVQKKWNKNFKQDAYTELMQIYSIFKINEFKEISFVEFSNKYFNEYLHEDWEINEKRTFINNLLNHFPKIVCRINEKNQFFFKEHEYRVAKTKLISRPEYILIEIKNAIKSKNYSDVLNSSFLKKVMKLGKSEDTTDANLNEIWDGLLQVCYALFEIPTEARTDLVLKDGENIRRYFYFNCLGDAVKEEIQRGFIYICGLLAGTVSDKRYCREKLTLLLESELREYKYRKRIIELIEKQFLNKVSLEEELEEVKKLLLSREEKDGDDSAVRVLLYAFLWSIKEKTKLDLSFLEEDFFVCIEGKQSEIAIAEDRRKKAYSKYGKSLPDTLKAVFKQEAYGDLVTSVRYIKRLSHITDYKDGLSDIKILDYDEISRGNITLESEESLLFNLIADFESSRSWDLLSKFYHARQDYSMKSAVNMVELLLFPKNETIQNLVFESFLRIMQNFDNQSRNPNFLVNHLYLLKQTKGNKRYDQYWEEFVNKLTKGNYIDKISKEDKKVLDQYIKYVTELTEHAGEKWCQYAGTMVYIMLRAYPEKITVFWACYKQNCIFERFLFEKKKGVEQELENASALLHILILSSLRNPVTNSVLENRLQNKIEKFVIKSNADKLYPRKIRGVLGALRDYRTNQGTEARWDNGVKERMQDVQQQILESFPGTISYDAIRNLCKGTPKEYLPVIQYCSAVYNENYYVQNNMYMILLKNLKAEQPKEFGMLLLELALRRLELNNGTNYLIDELRTLKTLYALNKLYYEEMNTAINDRIEAITVKHVKNSSSIVNQLEEYKVALNDFWESDAMDADLKKSILCCGMTNYWDDFVDDFLTMLPKEAEKKEQAQIVFNEYLKQIDYCVFRRCVLQKFEKALENDFEQKESGKTAKKYIDAPLYCQKDGMPTKVLSEACRLIASVIKKAPAKDTELILEKLRWALDGNNKKWEMFERNIVKVYAELEKIKEIRGSIYAILCAVTMSIFDYEDLMSLNFKMICNREKVVFAASFLEMFRQNTVFQSEINEADVTYYLCIGYALNGNGFAVNAEEAKAQGFFELAREKYERLLELEGENSADARKLKTEILDKMDRENFCVDETVMKKNSVIHDELFAFEFMVPEKASKLLKTLETEFKNATTPEEKCKLAGQIYYWLLYSNETGSFEYSDFVEEWLLAHLQSLTNAKSKAELLKKFYDEVHVGKLTKKTVYFQNLLAVLEKLLNEAEIVIPFSQDAETLKYKHIEIAQTSVEFYSNLYTELFDEACPERSGSVYKGVFAKLKNLDKENEDRVREQIEQLSNSQSNAFARNVISALKKRKKGAFEFTVLNMEDDTTNALFYQIKNISGKDADKLYLVLKYEDIVQGVDTIIKLKKDDIYAGCFDKLEHSVEEYSVHLYKPEEYNAFLKEEAQSSFIGTVIEKRGFCVFDADSWERADASSVAAMENLCVEKALEDWKYQYGVRNNNIVLRYNLVDIEESFSNCVVEWCVSTQKECCIINFGDEPFEISDVQEMLKQSKPKLVIWKNYYKALQYMTEEDWYNVYTNQLAADVRFIFCYYDYGKQESAKNYVSENVRRYVKEVFAKRSFKECLKREDITRGGVKLTFLDQTLECLERWSKGDINEADKAMDDFLEAEWKHERTYVYPSDIVEFLGMKGVVNTTELMVQQKANEIVANDSVDTLVRLYPQLPEDKQKDVRKALVSAKVLPDNAFITVEGNLIKVDNANEVLLGDKFQQNIQNNIMNIFQTTIYEQGDLEKLQKLNEELENLEKEAEQWRDSCSELREELEQNDKELEAVKKELAKKKKQLADATEATSVEKEKLEEDIKAAELLIEELSNNSDLLKVEVEQKQRELDKALEDARNKGIDVEAKNSRIEELSKEIADLNVKFDQQETEWVQKIDEKVESELNGKFRGIRLADMGHQLFPDLSVDKFDILCMIMKKYNYEQKFYNAVFVHYIFNFLSGILGENNEAMDYSSVNLMYSKLYESILKDKHLQIYENKLPNEDSPVVVYEDVNGQRVKRYKKFSELTVADDARITIGTFAEALKNKSSRNGQEIWWNLNRLSEVGQDNLYKSRAVSNAKWQLWDLHRQFIEKVTSIRNASLHGSRAGARITKAAMQELVDILFSGSMNTLTFVPDNGAFVQMFDVVSVQGVNVNQKDSGNRVELANFRRARQQAEEAEAAARLTAQASGTQTTE